MCGIVGLHLKDPALHPRLGALLAPMLDCMTGRGPDSAGIAVYDDDVRPGVTRNSVRAETTTDWVALASRLATALGERVDVDRRAQAAVLRSTASPDALRAALRELARDVTVVGQGSAIEVFKDVGTPRQVRERYGIAERSGFQGIGHTRMATESAVTTEHSHPFAPGADLSLVHNGSFSNHATVRRALARQGVYCETDNDSEVAARFVAHEMSRGADLGDALRLLHKTFDGFFTLLVGTATQFAVLRDSFACKPAVIAETDGYVAFGSEYQALTSLPGIGAATVFEPMPEEVHVWSRSS